MLLPLLACWLVGHLFRRAHQHRGAILAIGAILVLMINQRGFYWHPFPDQHGLLSLNRLSAMVIFALAFAGDWLIARITRAVPAHTTK